MGKYRGSDGWLHDDTVGPRRYHNRDITSGQPSKQPPKECPNCASTALWRRMEGVCRQCGWGKPESTPMSDEGAAFCCGLLCVSSVLPLVAMGVGYGFGGFGGLLVGLGLSGGALMGVVMFCVVIAGSSKEKDPEDG